ncbi:MAG: PqqD family peptide modification chaperone [Actinomycetota bacterium]
MRFASIAAPQPHRRVVQSPLGDALALFHLDTRRLHFLNGSAAAIWSALPEADTIDDLTVVLGDRFDVDPGEIRRDVDTAIDRLRVDGLVQVDDRFCAPTTQRADAAPPATEDGDLVIGALDARVAIRCDDEEIAATIGAILAPLAVDDAPTIVVSIAADGDVWTLSVGERPPVRLASPVSLVLRTLGEIKNHAVDSVPDHLVFHAGAVEANGRAVVLPAASNHGKSTLTTALVRHGFGYLSDEAAAIGSDGSVRPYPKAVALDPGSFPLFPDLAPSADVTGLGRTVACREWHVDPSRLGSVAAPTPVAAIVCPHWRAGASTRIAPIDPAEALHLLLGEAFDFSAGGQTVFDRLVRLVDEVPAFRLGYSDLDEAVHAVRTVLVD